MNDPLVIVAATPREAVEACIKECFRMAQGFRDAASYIVENNPQGDKAPGVDMMRGAANVLTNLAYTYRRAIFMDPRDAP